MNLQPCCPKCNKKKSNREQDPNTEEIFETEEIRVSKYVIAKRGLNLRDFPTTEPRATVLKTLAHGTEVLSLGGNEDWSLIEYEGQRYFCSTFNLYNRRRQIV